MPTTITTPKLWIPGDPLNKANLDKEVRDQLTGMIGGPFCHTTMTVALTYTTATETLVAWNSEVEDSDTMHDTVTNNSRITVPLAGLYMVRCSFRWSPNPTSWRWLRLRANGATQLGEVTEMAVGGGGTTLQIEKLVRLNVNDYVEATVRQDSGGNLVNEVANGNPCMQVMWERV